MYCYNCNNLIWDKPEKVSQRPQCFDCRNSVKTKSSYGTCFSHVGEYDKSENPVTKFGQIILQGFRKCGNQDCINKKHVINALEFERLSVFRNGQKLSQQYLVSVLELEKFG